jgi:ADP-ribosylglycohydrolase
MSNKHIKPHFEGIHVWEDYSAELRTEFRQSIEEGLDLSAYGDLFTAVSRMPKSEERTRIADVLYDLVLNAPLKEGYPYREPSDLEGIRALRKPHPLTGTLPAKDVLADKIYGAWLGRIVGCLLGKPVEGIRTNELIPLLRASGNYPMHRYILSSDITEELCNTYKFKLRGKCYADTVSGMPVDDDTNYVVLAQKIVEKHGRDFTACHVAQAWLWYQPKDAYCTAERVAFRNFVNGYRPPESALYKNPYREWVGAQIRGDYFGYINPGNPALAAEMAFRDASISHVKNGIYGELFIAAMIAAAAVTDCIKDILLAGLGEIPATSRLYEAVSELLRDFESGVTEEDAFKKIHTRFDEHNGHDWCHTISNALIVSAALLYGKGDFGRSICMAVETGFDTDCNGATVGSILGMRNGSAAIGDEWVKPLEDCLHTTIFGVGTVSIRECAEKTMAHLPL